MDPMTHWIQLVIAIITSIFASSGLWAFMSRKSEKHTTTTQLLMGLARERLVYLGMSYINRGYVTKDEYEDYIKYLYVPYTTFGGNGLAERVMNEVSRLPLAAQPAEEAILQDFDHGNETAKKPTRGEL